MLTRRYKPDCSIILPCLNEEDSLPALVADIVRVMGRERYELVFVDDGSKDGTWSVISAFLSEEPGWQGVRLTRPFGHQAALLAGLSAAKGAAIITLDADGQHPPEWLPRMLREWRHGAKVVQMVRRQSDDGALLKRITSRLFYRVYGRLCDIGIVAASADFRLLDRDVVDTILSMKGPVPFLRGLIPWLGCETVEVGYVAKSRIAGESEYSFHRMVRLALDGVLSFTIVPLRLGIWMGALIGLMSFLYLCYIAGVGLFSEAAVPGWASTAGLMALLGGTQLFCVGLLGEYLGRLYINNLGRPPFVIRERRGSSLAVHGDKSLKTEAEPLQALSSSRLSARKIGRAKGTYVS